MKNNIYLFLLGAMLFACSDGNKTSENYPPKVATTDTVFVPTFNSDSAFSYVEKQVAFGPRVPNTAAHKASANYFVTFFNANADTVYEQSFTATAFDKTPLELTNIIASINPKAPKRILLCAHWDTRPFSDQDDESLWQTPIDGANDGGSGVGILMEIARVIQAENKLKVGVDIVLFDGEDYGQPHFHDGEGSAESWCLGSQYWSKHFHKPGYRAYYGILLDMVGAKNATFYKEGVSRNYAPLVVNQVWSAGQKLGYGAYFVNKNSDPITDDHTFINSIAGIPTIDIIHHDPESTNFYFGNYWHTQEDNMEAVSKETLKAVGQTLLYVLYHE